METCLQKLYWGYCWNRICEWVWEMGSGREKGWTMMQSQQRSQVTPKGAWMCVWQHRPATGKGSVLEWALALGWAAPSSQGQCFCELEDYLQPGGSSLGSIQSISAHTLQHSLWNICNTAIAFSYFWRLTIVPLIWYRSDTTMGHLLVYINVITGHI